MTARQFARPDEHSSGGLIDATREVHALTLARLKAANSARQAIGTLIAVAVLTAALIAPAVVIAAWRALL